MSFVHLHNHTHFSLLDAATKPEELIKAAAADGQPAIAITDHGVMFGTIEFYLACEKQKNEDLKLAVCSAIRAIKKLNIKSVKLSLVQNDKELKIQDLVEGLELGFYEFSRYKSEEKKKKDLQIIISAKNSNIAISNLEKELHNAISITSSVNMVRNIVNTPPEDYYPEVMAEDALMIAKNNDLQCLVHGEEYLLENGMNAMFNVGRASRHESKLIHLTYKPKNSKGKIVLVGNCGSSSSSSFSSRRIEIGPKYSKLPTFSILSNQ